MNNTALRLRLLICNPKSLGQKKIPGRTTAEIVVTSQDRYDASLFSYECKSLKQWREKSLEFAKAGNANQFFTTIMFVDDTTGKRVDPVPGALYVMLPPVSEALESPQPPQTPAGTDDEPDVGNEKSPGETLTTPEPADACGGPENPPLEQAQAPLPAETPAEDTAPSEAGTPAHPEEPEPEAAPAPKPKTGKGKKK